MNWTEEELEKIIVSSVTKVIEEHETAIHSNCRLSNDDIVFFRRLKNAIDNTSKWVGHGIIVTIIAGFVYIVKLGLDAYRGAPNG